MQEDYDSGKEFVYFILCYSEKWNREKISNYEKFYMTLMKKFGFELYNSQCKNCESTPQQLNILLEDVEKASPGFIKDFVCRFGIALDEFFSCSMERRKMALNYYAEKRFNFVEKFKGDRFMFNRQSRQRLFGENSKSISSIDIEEMLISKCGNYLGEGIDQIINYELKSIKQNGYCLWTFAYNAVSLEKVKEHCEKRQQVNKDTYVIFEYTPSSAYAASTPLRFDCLKMKDAKALKTEELKFLSFEQKGENFYVPEAIDCTATGSSRTTLAFVVQELFLLDEVLDFKKFSKYYGAVVKEDDNLREIKAMGKQRSTLYLKSKGLDLNIGDIILEGNVRRKFCFCGRLAAPYILRLRNEE